MSAAAEERGSRQLRILVDTNVWLDYFLPARAGHGAAFSFLDEAQRRGVQLLYPASCITDVFYLLLAQLKGAVRHEKGSVSEADTRAVRKLAWGCIECQRELACAVGVDESDLWLACKYRKLTDDLEDNVVLAAAQRAQADFLATGDAALLAKANVAALAPADMLVLLQA